MVIHGVTPGGKKKVEHAVGAVALAASGRVYLPEDNPMFPLDDVISEVTRFTGDESKDANDDICDTMFYMADMLPFVTGTGGPSRGASAYKPQGGR
jgi:hypothetical protein